MTVVNRSEGLQLINRIEVILEDRLEQIEVSLISFYVDLTCVNLEFCNVFCMEPSCPKLMMY